MLDDTPRFQMMINKLKIEVGAGRIENDWVENFIFNMDKKLKNKQTLSQPMKDKIEELFEQY